MLRSKFLKFKNIQLSDYLEVKTNRVLRIDDISPEFSSSDDSRELFSNILTIDPTRNFNRFLVQVIDSTGAQNQLTEIITLNDDDDIFTLVKGSITTEEGEDLFADISGFADEFGNMYLRFEPENPYLYDYTIKILKNEFVTRLSGINTVSIGCIDLLASNTNTSGLSTSTILSLNSNKYNSVHSSINVINSTLGYKSYVEIYLTHDGQDTYLSEMYFDDVDEYNGRFIGTFSSSISNGLLKLDFHNTSGESVSVRSRNVGFGSTQPGIGTYRFNLSGQPSGSERTATYDSSFASASGTSPILVKNADKNLFTSIKSLVKVSVGNTSALHQIMVIHDNTNISTYQCPFLSIGSTSGIGTFGGQYFGDQLEINFYPDNNVSGEIKIISFNENLYTINDEFNIPPPLEYTPNSESLNISNFYGTNLSSINKTNFNLLSDGTPIFVKSFNPQNNNTLNKETGVFSIKNHFFSTGEELIYSPNSTFIGVGQTAMGIGATMSYTGVTTNKLPDKVYAIKISPDQFKLSTRKEYAQSGIYVTFTDNGSGNLHELEMVKKSEKSLITINELTQYPLAYTSLSFNLVGNGGQIGTASTIFALSGISSINPTDLLKIDEEFVYVNNVGLGTTNSGPISFTGNIPLVDVSRGAVGTIPKFHNDSTNVRVYRGSYNIIRNELHFTNPPRGSSFYVSDLDFSNLSREKASFNGRVFLRSNYDANIIYDSISEKFTGLDKSYNLTYQGINTVGFGTSGGNGVVFINSIFQAPSTLNNSENNFDIIENNISGITSVVFSGITDNEGNLIISESDVNQNQLPRGGVIVSLGSTPGLGYAPLVGASVTAILNGGGSIIGFSTNSNFGSGYRNPVSISVSQSGHVGTSASITGTVGAGGTVLLSIANGGSGYTIPLITISSPSYENLPVIGVSRLGIGNTTETGTGLLLNVEMGAGSTSGIGSTTFEVTSFKIMRNGYGFRRGDVFKPVGLVTAKGLSIPIKEFELTVLDIFNDSFASWQFGEFNYIDNIKNYQDGVRTRFPLYYNSQLLSFQKNNEDLDSQLIDLSSLLLIFINGILQNPGTSYEFDGGTSFTFTTPPKSEDNISIFFYLGTRDIDSVQVNINESLKIGDELKVLSNNNLLQSTLEQSERIVIDIPTSDKVETPIYSGQGVDDINYRPVSWIKQKRDLIINNEYISKVRDSLESQIYPTSKVIKDFSNSSSEIFVDSIELFEYEEQNPAVNKFDLLIMDDGKNISSAGATAIVSSSGTIQSISITNPGSGYTGSSIPIKFANPLVGVGTTATALLSIVNGSVSLPATITNPGFGYSQANPPRILIPSPDSEVEILKDCSNIIGFDGVITSISTTTGIGTALALRFDLGPDSLAFSEIQIGYPIYIFDTSVGTGITSINTLDSDVIGVSTTGVDNIYYIHAFNSTTGIATCNIRSNTNVSGLSTTGSLTNPVGKFSWGRISGFSRSSSPISLSISNKTTSSGLSTYPTVQRRGYGLRDTGSIKKFINSI